MLLRPAGSGARWPGRCSQSQSLISQVWRRRMTLAGSPVTRFTVSLLQQCTMNGLWISASWVGAGKSPGYSHLGTKEVKRSKLVYRGRKCGLGSVFFVCTRFCAKRLPGSSLFITSTPPSRWVPGGDSQESGNCPSLGYMPVSTGSGTSSERLDK